jgi:hypothetical protein
MVENTTSAENTGQDSIASLVQVKLRKSSVLSSIFMDVTSFAMPGDKSISFPRWTNAFQVQKLVGAQKGDDQEALFDLDKLELSEEAHIQWVIKKFDQARAKVQILQQAIGEATVQHALGLDADMYVEFDTSIHAGNILTPGALSQDSIVDMITAANVARIPKADRSWLFSNASYGSLLKIDGFVDASKSNLEIVRTGQIGTLYGYPVFESDEVESGHRYLVHKAALAYGFGASPELEDQKAIEYGTGSRRWVMDQLYGVKAMNLGKLVIKQANP